MNKISFTRSRNKRNTQDNAVFSGAESKKIIKDFKNSQSWSEYMADQLDEFVDIIEYFKWPTQMVKHFKYISKINNGIKYQSKFYFEEYNNQIHPYLL